jgi:predicted phage-related endonuclease
MSAAHDALVEDRAEGIEAKYVGPTHADEWGPDGSDIVPPYVVLQVQHQMSVSDLHAVWVGAAIARWQLEFRVYRIARDNAIIEAIREVCQRFWNDHVLPRVPPDDATLPPLDVLRAIKREQKAVEVAPDIVRSAIFWDRVSKRCDGLADQAKRALEAAMGTGNVALLDGAPVYKLANVSSKRFDAAAWKAAHPELVAEYMKESNYQRGTWTKTGKQLEVTNDGYDIAGLIAGDSGAFGNGAEGED